MKHMTIAKIPAKNVAMTVLLVRALDSMPLPPVILS